MKVAARGVRCKNVGDENDDDWKGVARILIPVVSSTYSSIHSRSEIEIQVEMHYDIHYSVI